jgi:hypothetical protein
MGPGRKGTTSHGDDRRLHVRGGALPRRRRAPDRLRLPLPRLPVRLRRRRGQCADRTRGELRNYCSVADSGAQIGRQFCEICGTPILSDLESQPDLLVIKAGSLDDPATFKPTANLWTAAAQPWHAMDADIPSFPQGPAGDR